MKEKVCHLTQAMAKGQLYITLIFSILVILHYQCYCTECPLQTAYGRQMLTLQRRSQVWDMKQLKFCIPLAHENVSMIRLIRANLDELAVGTLFDNLTKLSELQMIYCQKCDKLPTSAFDGTPLVRLNITSGDLVNIPQLANLKSMKYFFLDCNKITELYGKQFSKYPELTLVSLRNNMITKISDNAFTGTKLNTLHLSNNSLKCMPEFKGVELTLSVLHIERNRATNCENKNYTLMQGLQILQAEFNRYIQLPKILTQAPNLLLLFIQYNNLTSLPDLTHLFPKAISLDIAHNPLVCSCNMSWILNSSNIKIKCFMRDESNQIVEQTINEELVWELCPPTGIQTTELKTEILTELTVDLTRELAIDFTAEKATKHSSSILEYGNQNPAISANKII